MWSPNDADRRNAPRRTCETLAKLTILREYGPAGEMSVTVAECSSSGMKLMSPEEVSPGDAVRVDVGDALLLGEVVHASRQDCTAQRTWVVGVRFEQGIFGLAALQKLLAAITGADSRAESASVRSVDSEGTQALDQGNGKRGGEQEQKKKADTVRLAASAEPPL